MLLCSLRRFPSLASRDISATPTVAGSLSKGLFRNSLNGSRKIWSTLSRVSTFQSVDLREELIVQRMNYPAPPAAMWHSDRSYCEMLVPRWKAADLTCTNLAERRGSAFHKRGSWRLLSSEACERSSFSAVEVGSLGGIVASLLCCPSIFCV